MINVCYTGVIQREGYTIRKLDHSKVEYIERKSKWETTST